VPLTAPGCVDLIVTDVAVIEVTVKRLLSNEVASGWSPEDMQALTLPTLLVNPDCKEIEL
jgi:acyl CoA:acetate/3-ketoacid CoA transferase beta subunit